MAGETAGNITIDDAADQIAISSRDIGTQLYQAKIDYVGSPPRFSYADGKIRITRSSNFVNFWGRPRDVVALSVNPSVAWTIVVDGAGTTTRIDLSNANLRSFKLNGAASNVTITASPPHGIVRVSADGVGIRLTLQVPGTVEYRVTAEGIGATVDGHTQTPGWSTAEDRCEVSVNEVGANATVTTTG